MAHDFQITIDSRTPHDLADWWAAYLQWDLEPSNEDFIREMIAQGHAQESDTTTHNGVLVWTAGQAITHPETKQRVLFQHVPEAKSVKNRIHFDINVGADNIDAAVEAATKHGGTFLHDGAQGPFRWKTLTDPEGNEFCVR